MEPVAQVSKKVSIIMASYNKELYIGETINSVLGQTHRNWELIIVDDCSTDSTRQVVKDFLADQRITLIERLTNTGANVCRNLGLKEANGEYVMFLDADDLLSPTCLTLRLDKALEHPQSNLLVFTMGVFQKMPGDTNADWVPRSKHPLTDFLQHKLPWSILQPLWKREFLNQLGGFDELFKRLQDVELNTRALLSKNVNCVQVVSPADCFYRIDEERKNFDPHNFLKRWIEASLMYYTKFAKLLSGNSRNYRYLVGTIYQVYLALLMHYKQNLINEKSFKELELKLFSGIPTMDLRYYKKTLFTISKYYNLYLPRISGINWLLKRLVISASPW